ncbi:MAG: MaoC family dehydratase [Dehalococcoidales bacterium]|nr:MaoC family dehydratase [Dehalococcoidales bacterium]
MKDMKSFEDINIGYELPSVTMKVTEERIWLFADATKDYNPIHLDPPWVKGYQFGKTRLNNVIGHGLMTFTVMNRTMTDWVWPLGGTHHRLEARFISPAYPGNTIMTQAKVVEKKITGGKKFLVLEVMTKDQTGAVLSQGTALESLP